MSNDYRDSYHVGNRSKRNPFDSIQIIPHLEWCKSCKMDVDVQTESANADGIDVYRKRCKRCGKVIQCGIGRRHLANGKPLPKAALRFIQKSGLNRT